MAQQERGAHLVRGLITGAVLGTAVLIILTMLSAALDTTAASSGINITVAVLTGLTGIVIGYASSAQGDNDDYQDVSINEMMSARTESEAEYPEGEYVYVGELPEADYPVDPYDHEMDDRSWAQEAVTMYPVPPTATHTTKMPVLTMDELAEASKVIKGHVLKTLTALPPLPSKEPTIHKVVLTVDEVPTPVEPKEKQDGENNLRDTLEASDLRDVIGFLGEEGYIDALQYCLDSSEAGSQIVVLRAKGRVYGLGARGTKKEDGSTDFTRADVQKMIRKARSRTSANVSD